MTTVADFIAGLQVEVKNTGNTNSETGLRLAMTRALKRLSPMRTTFNEGTFTFTTVASQAAYDTSDSGFAVDIQEIEYLEINTGQGYTREIDVATIDKIRRLLGTSPSTTTYPQMYCWFNNKIYLAQAPGSALTVTAYYVKDAQRDSATGTLIGSTTASDAYTNPWFDAGQDALWCKTMQIYHAAFAVDPERAQYYANEWAEAAAALHSGWVRKEGKGMKAEPYL